MAETTKVRNEGFAQKPVTRIWHETESESSPYTADRAFCHGYDLVQLASHCSFAATLFLLLKGELPSEGQEKLFNTLLVAMINAGPRHQAVRAAQLAGAGKTDPQHILSIGLAALGGEAERLPAIMKFMVRAARQSPSVLLDSVDSVANDEDLARALPGFGRRFGEADPLLKKLADVLLSQATDSSCLRWGSELHDLLAARQAGWLRTGLIAAILLDLGFPARSAGVLYQLINAPGIAAHGLEMHGLPRTALPFLADEHYFQVAADE